VSEAWFGFLGVIVGAVVSLLGEQFTTRREREARKAVGEQERKDGRDAFQRETILALQEAIAQFWQSVMIARIEAAGQPLALLGSAEAQALHLRINMLRARIFDDELRGVVKEVLGHIHGAGKASDVASFDHHARTAERLTRQMDDQVNVLLKDLF
jgi:hypothetical protein